MDRQRITTIAESIGVDYASFAAFISVESGGIGFAEDTGKIIIQFEPAKFKKYIRTRKPEHVREWAIIDANKVEGQAHEWLAFNAAYKINSNAALLNTSIGIMQVMGFNYQECGYASVNAMWDDFKIDIYHQIQGAANFIKNKPALLAALKIKKWDKVAYNYNGSNYAVNQYDKKMEKAYIKYHG